MSSNTSHDPKVISVFEIIGAYFTDTVFNHVYHSAKTNITNKSSLTDEYVKRINAYVIGVKNDSRCYIDVIQGVHKYFISTTRYTTLSFAEFVDRIVGVCVPEEYFRQFSPSDKDEILSSVVCDLVSNIAVFTTRPDMLRRIIDDHTKSPEVTIRMIQDAAVNSLITKRSILHNKFLKKMGQSRETVSMDIVEDMKKALRRLVSEKNEVTAELNEFKQKLIASKTKEAKLLKLIDLLKRAALEGPAAVGTSLRVPTREHIAETNMYEPDLQPSVPATQPESHLPANFFKQSVAAPVKSSQPPVKLSQPPVKSSQPPVKSSQPEKPQSQSETSQIFKFATPVKLVDQAPVKLVDQAPVPQKELVLDQTPSNIFSNTELDDLLDDY